MTAPYRLGIDIGTNSLGWCLLDLDRDGKPRGIRRIGVRIFGSSPKGAGRDPQRGTSLAVERRVPRQQRRRRDRYLKRRARLMDLLVRYGLMPRDAAERKHLECLDPYELRARAVDEALPLHHLGRALFHLNQRRGFRSNRKTDKAEDEKESEGIKGAITTLGARIRETGARTLGEYLFKTSRQGRSVRQCLPVRARKRGVGAKAQYDLYPSRAMYEAEFDALWAKQREFHTELTNLARDEIRNLIFHQRPLRPVDPGKCTLDPTDQRAPEALPIVQQFRIYQELANLKIERPGEPARFLDKAERDRIFFKLERTRELSFDRIRSLLDLGSEVRFNLESERRRALKGDLTGTLLAKKPFFGPVWWTRNEEQRNAIVEALLGEESEERLIAMAIEEWRLDPEAARAVAAVTLPQGYARLGRKALAQIVPRLREKGFEGYRYSDAAKDAGYHHSDFRTGELLETLPYYGQVLDRYVAWGTGDPADAHEKRYGRIANPTVHIGLNELRKVVNAIIAKYGRPESIVVELARELKLGLERQQEIERQQSENQAKNERRRKELAELQLPDNGENLLRLRLWEELNPGEPHNRRCPYTGEQISKARLFGPEVEIEHILPFRRTLDNSAANKIVSMRYANRAKGNLSPYEAFNGGPTIDGRKYDWDAILARASDLPKNKRWRFQPDAMNRFEEEGDFLDRQLTDTQYLARLTREYLTKVCPGNVWVTPGRLTEMLRGKWGLNQLLWDHNLKKRVDHRHHAIDAFVVAVTDRGMLNSISRAADQARNRLIDDMPEPQIPDFREALRRRLDQLVVSHKPDHGRQGKLHEETAYGLIKTPLCDDGHTLVHRKALEDLNENEIDRVRDRRVKRSTADHEIVAGADLSLRGRIKTHITAAKGRHEGEWSAAALKAALVEFGTINRIRRVRLTKPEAEFIRLERPGGQPYKAYVPGDNHHIDIIEIATGRWTGKAITVFAANQEDGSPRSYNGDQQARLIMRVHKGDLLRMEVNGEEHIMRVVRLEPSAQRLRLAEHNESGDLQKRHSDADDPFRWTFVAFNQLRSRRARKVTVDVLGRVRDPGPPT